MSNARVNITFNTLPADYVGTADIKFNAIRIADNASVGRNETWAQSRNNAGLIPYSESTTLNDVAYAYAKYLALDYGTRLFQIIHIPGTNSVELIMLSENYEFEYVQSGYGDLQTISIAPPDLDVTTFSIDNVSFAEAVDPYNNVRIDITTTGIAKYIYLNEQLIDGNNSSNPFYIDVPRGIDTKIKLIDNQGLIRKWGYDRSFYRFPIFAVDSVKVDVRETVNGATVTLNVDYLKASTTLTDLVFQYSLDGTNWFSSNIFSGQAPGAYTAYVKDQYGITRQTEFNVNGLSSRIPFLYISKANALNFKEMQEWDNYTIYKTEDNTFESQSFESTKYCFPILLQTGDKTKIQLKSSFNTVEATVRREDETTVALNVEKLTNNLDRYESLDAKYYNYSETYTGIYFESGKKYDENGLEISDYVLNGNLPDLAIKDQYIGVIGSGYYKIKDLIFDSNINKKVILVDSFYTGATTVECIIESIYDLLPFDVYEFEINWSAFGIGLYDVIIENSNDGEDLISHVSENINILAEQEETLAIRYFNDNNRDIFYKYGIEHFIRVPYAGIKRGFEEDFENSIGDLTSATTTSKLRVVDEFIFTDLTTSFMRTVCIALSCENLFINNVGYIKNAGLEIEQIPNTNLYEVKASLLRTNISYTTNRQGQVGKDIGYVEFDIPTFVYTGSGFLTT
jgi:hypothetical protein